MESKSWQVFVMHLDLLDVLLSMNLKNAKTTYNFGIESNLDDNCCAVLWVHCWENKGLSLEFLLSCELRHCCQKDLERKKIMQFSFAAVPKHSGRI
jgi:hypothetical protein